MSEPLKNQSIPRPEQAWTDHPIQPADTSSLPRQIVVFEPDLNRNSLKRIRQECSIRHIAHTNDFQISGWQPPRTSDAGLVVFDRLGVGLLTLDDPDQASFLMRRNHRHRPFCVVRPESTMKLLLTPGSDPIDNGPAELEADPPLPDTGRRQPRVQRASLGSRMVKGFEDNARHSWALQACGITQARWSGRGVKIAILDTGLDFHHCDWANRPVSHQSFVDGTAQDLHGHGTQCAGLAAGAAADKGMPRFGAAPLADLYIAKVLNPNGSGPDSAILAGIDWALGQGCQILSLSVGMQTDDTLPDPVYELVARRCLRSGLLFMAAAGNDSARPGLVRPVCRPASSPSVFAVGAVDRYSRLAQFTNGTYDKGCGQIDAVAPGVDVLTTSMGPQPYGRFSGTSMAAPLCAGLAALFVQEDPECLGYALWQRLASIARRLMLPSIDVGVGLVTLSSQKLPGLN